MTARRRLVAWAGTRYGLIVGAVLLLSGAGSALAQTAVHTNGCQNCHRLHGTAGTALTDFTVSEDLCLSCHVDGGDPKAPKGVASHVSARYSATVTCVTCHGHQGSTGGNLALIRDSIVTPRSGKRNVTFTSRGTDAVAGVPPSRLPGAGSARNSFADGDATLDGVCEVCHTRTANHQNGTVQPDASNHAHYAGLQCTKCHVHRDRNGEGFTGSGPCAACHDVGGAGTTGPNSRRPIIPELARASYHVGSAYADGDCLVCHDMSRHQQGNVRLVNADDPATVSVVTGNPRTSAATAATLSPFCLACHDGRGPSSTKQPFSDNAAVPVVDSARWVASAHGATPVIAGCFGDGSFGCHATAHGSQKRRLLAPDAVAPTPPANPEEEEGFCFNCHDGNPARTNVLAEFQKGTNTATQIFHHPVSDAQQAAGRPVECADCHNPHQATPDATAPVAPAASSRLIGVARVSVTNGAAGTVPTYTFRPATDPTAPREYELCFKCHSSWTGQPAGQSNLALELNTNNASYHPVEGTGKNTNINLNAFVNGWAATRTMYCTDCHTSDNAAVRGPHGSTNRYILKKPYTASSAQRPMSSGESCFDCHNYDTYANRSASNTVQGYSRFNPPAMDKGHTFHVAEKERPCYACHDSHGSATGRHLIVTGRSPGIISYTETATGGSCTPTCHNQKAYSISYPR